MTMSKLNTAHASDQESYSGQSTPEEDWAGRDTSIFPKMSHYGNVFWTHGLNFERAYPTVLSLPLECSWEEPSWPWLHRRLLRIGHNNQAKVY